MKRLPLHDTHLRDGVVFGEFDGWDVPLHYGDWEKEYYAAKEGAAISDLSFRGKLRVRGSDRTSFLQNMLTNDVKALTPGEKCYSALLTDRAKMVSDMFVFAFEDSFLLDLEPAACKRAREFLEKYIIADDVTIEDETSATGHILLQGQSTGCVPIVCPVESLKKMWMEHVNGGAVPIGHKARETMRIEAGIPRFGVDMDETVLILEAGLDHAISFTKGCYLGQEVVARVTSRGRVNRKLIRLVLPGTDPVKKGEKIVKDGKEAGEITSSVFSPSQCKTVALGYVAIDWSEPGTALQVAGREAIVSPAGSH